MALINCPECNKEISDSVKKCPNCGYRIKQTNKKRKKSLIIIPVVIILACVGLLIFLNQLTETEQRIIECVQTLKSTLKNPESLKVYDIQQYYNKFEEEGEEIETNYLMIYYSAENEYGGKITGYVIFDNWRYYKHCNVDEVYNNPAYLSSFIDEWDWNDDDNIMFDVNRIIKHVK